MTNPVLSITLPVCPCCGAEMHDYRWVNDPEHPGHGHRAKFRCGLMAGRSRDGWLVLQGCPQAMARWSQIKSED